MKGKTWLTVAALLAVTVPVLGSLGVLPPVAVAVIQAAVQAAVGVPPGAP